MRHEAGLTQRQLANLMREAGSPMYQSTIGKIEAGSRTVSIGEAVQFAAALGVQLSDIIDGQMGGLLSERLRVATLEYQASNLTRRRDEAQILLDDTLAKLQRARAEVSGQPGCIPGGADG